MSVGSRKQWESQVETIYMIRPTHLNSAGRLFGGILMQWIDEAAGLVAIRHSRRNVTTASVDNLQFLEGAYQGDTVIIKAKLTMQIQEECCKRQGVKFETSDVSSEIQEAVQKEINQIIEQGMLDVIYY